MPNRRQFLQAGVATLGAFASPSLFALDEGRPSRTAFGAARHRAAHQILEYPRVFNDPYALPILGIGGEDGLRAELANHQQPGARSMRAFMALRSRYAEDRLTESLDRGVRQYVILGAGLDTYGYRNPHAWRGLRVFEVDFPATQEWKCRQLAEAGISAPGSLRYAPVDFEKQTIADGLRAAGFRFDQPAFLSMLGVVIYLSRPAIEDTLRFVAGLAPGSELVFDFALPFGELGPYERLSRIRSEAAMHRIGEPWISTFNADQLSARMRATGFSHAGVLDANEANARYFAAREDGFRLSGSGRMMAAIV